jgi:hypothetical protein
MTPRKWLELARAKDPNRLSLGWIQRDRGRWLTSDGLRVHVTEPDEAGGVSIPPSVADMQTEKMPQVFACGESHRFVTCEGLNVTWPASLELRSCMPMARAFDEVVADALRERWEVVTIGAKQLRGHLKGVPHFVPSAIAAPWSAQLQDGFAFKCPLVRDAIALAKPGDLVRVEYSPKPATPCLLRVDGVSRALVMPFRTKRGET